MIWKKTKMVKFSPAFQSNIKLKKHLKKARKNKNSKVPASLALEKETTNIKTQEFWNDWNYSISIDKSRIESCWNSFALFYSFYFSFYNWSEADISRKDLNSVSAFSIFHLMLLTASYKKSDKKLVLCKKSPCHWGDWACF